jgi:hypothetical protein
LFAVSHPFYMPNIFFYILQATHAKHSIVFLLPRELCVIISILACDWYSATCSVDPQGHRIKPKACFARKTIPNMP